MYIQLRIKANSTNAELISDILLGLDAAAVTLIDAKDQPLLEPAPGTTPFWDDAWVSGLFPAEVKIETIITQLKSILSNANLEYLVIPLADQNWERAWLEHFKPLKFGKHLWITASEQQHLIEDPNAIKIILDPGLAFGTGTHPTTALCLEWLANHLKTGQTVIDYGCGSGILAISAAKLGATVVAIDNDPQAITATKENAKRNHISAKSLQTFLTSNNPLAITPADILIANILANTLITLAKTLSNLVKPKGYIVLSGILTDQAAAVMAAYTPCFQFEIPLEKDGWICLVGKKSS